MVNNQDLRIFYMTKDKAFFEAFYDKYEYYLFNIAYKLTGDIEQSEILLIKVLIKIKTNPTIVLEAPTKNQSFALFKLIAQVHKEHFLRMLP